MKKNEWTLWNGEELASPLAFDTETDMSPKDKNPNSYQQQLVVFTASDGQRHYVVPLDRLRAFIKVHAKAVWVGFNTRFDFWVVRAWLVGMGHVDLVNYWDTIPDQGRLRDVMILDFLVRLASLSKPEVLRLRGLSDVAAEYGIWMDKSKKKRITQKQREGGASDPMREGFGQYLGQPLSNIPQEMLDYAVDDTVYTHEVFIQLNDRAEMIAAKWSPNGNNPHPHGLLTETLQVRADIVLAAIGKQGFGVDAAKAAVLKDRLWGEIWEMIGWFQKKYPKVFDYYTPRATSGVPGGLKIKKDTQLPSLKRNGLLSYLGTVVAEYKIPLEHMPLTPKGVDKKGNPALSLSMEPWVDVARGHEFVDTWSRYSDTLKLHQFLKKVQGHDRTHSDYRILVRTGRTSCTGGHHEGWPAPNIQQWPRDAELRSVFQAAPGHVLVISDYSAIELGTLASVLLDRYKKSRLAEVLREGRDPHIYTASMVTGETYERFLVAHNQEKDDVRHAKKFGLPLPATPHIQGRQAAKPINFGVPGGLGPRRLAGYAHSTYHVDISVEQSATLRTKLITEVYPELFKYLESFEPISLARNLGVSLEQVIDEFDPPYDSFWYTVQRIVGITDGLTMKGTKYSAKLQNHVWETLARLNRNPNLDKYLDRREGAPIVRRLLFGDVVVTRTGRVRKGADYGEARNTPFQGLAADGAKVAMWMLWRQVPQWPIVAFIHDEFVNEVPIPEAEVAVKEIGRIMQEAMASVVENNIPISVEQKVSDRWTK